MSDDTTVLVAAVEGGGTSFVVAVAEIDATDTKNDPRILHRAEIDSSHDDPSRTLEECASFFREHRGIREDGYRALGVAMFGPLGCNPDDEEHYGTILVSTPKKSWRGVDVLTPLIRACESEESNDNNNGNKPKLAVKIDTDVNAPAMAEFRSVTQNQAQNQDQSISSLAYVTVGTGVGVGLVVHGKPVHGKMHPEGGHVPIQPLEGDTFRGYSWGAGSKSPFGGMHTVESMASSVALAERLAQLRESGGGNNGSDAADRARLAELEDDDHEVWHHAANALANLCATLGLVVSVERIVLGGGVSKRRGLVEKVRARTRVLLNGYLGELSDDHLATWISRSSLGSDVGLVGAIELAEQAIAESQSGSDSGSDTGASATIRKMKRTAFNSGLWHGFVLGVSAVYIGVCVWARSGKSSGRR